MAYTATPSINVEQTKQINLFSTVHPRRPFITNETDYQVLNGVLEIDKNKQLGDGFKAILKRDGTTRVWFSPSGQAIKGLHYYEKENIIIVFSGSTVYALNGTTYVLLSSTATPFTGSSEVNSVDYLYETGTTTVISTNGSALIELVLNSGGVVSATASTSPDLPLPHINVPVFLNGYIYLAKLNTADMYNSNLNAPLSFTAGDFLSAESFPDNIKFLGRVGVYVAAFGSTNLELFWDAANDTGSPLKRYDVAIKKVGYLGGYAEYEDTTIFVGKTPTTSPKVYMMENLKLTEISDSFIIRWLAETTETYTATVCSHSGHMYYILSTEQQTWQYELETKLWTKLKRANGVINNFPILRSFTKPAVYQSHFSYVNESGLYKFTPNSFTDEEPTTGTNTQISSYSFEILTEPQKFESYRKKYGQRLKVHVDREFNTDLEVSWTDDDYVSYSPSRLLNNKNASWYLQRLGSFVERAFKLKYLGNTRLRVYSLEIDYTLGLQ
jgi:hypothetical protein